MKTIKVSEAQVPVLNWLVAKCEGHEIDSLMGGAVWYWLKCSLTGAAEVVEVFNPSTDWAQGGPIIERECMDVMFEGPEWYAYMRWESGRVLQYDGQTPLIAAMRCYVASKLGDKVEVPDDLL